VNQARSNLQPVPPCIPHSAASSSPEILPPLAEPEEFTSFACERQAPPTHISCLLRSAWIWGETLHMVTCHIGLLSHMIWQPKGF